MSDLAEENIGRLVHRVFVGVVPQPEGINNLVFENSDNVVFENNDNAIL